MIRETLASVFEGDFPHSFSQPYPEASVRFLKRKMEYESGELLLQQLTDNNTCRSTAVLTSDDWSVLCLVMQSKLWRDSPSPQPPGVEEADQCVILSVLWETRSAPPAHWFFRASVRMWRRGDKMFVLENFNSDCGLYSPILVLPLAAWRDRMSGVCEKITRLFHSCQAWNERLLVRKQLNFAVLPPIAEEPPLTVPLLSLSLFTCPLSLSLYPGPHSTFPLSLFSRPHSLSPLSHFNRPHSTPLSLQSLPLLLNFIIKCLREFETFLDST